MRFPVQWLRHAVQGVTVVLIVGLALLAGYRAARPGQGAAAAAEHSIVEQVRGNSWSLEVGELSLTDLLAGVESLVVGRFPTSALLIGLVVPLLVTVAVGRVFCTWVCPVGFLLEMADWVGKRIARVTGPVRNVRFWRGNKYVLLVAGLGLGAMLSFPLLGSFYPPALLVREIQTWMYGAFADGRTQEAGGITWGLVFLGGILGFELLVSRRAWCRYLCPGGALYSLLGSRRLARVSKPDASCDRCTDCVAACGMGLNPMEGVTGLECDNCLVCVSSCPPQALHLQVLPGAEA